MVDAQAAAVAAMLAHFEPALVDEAPLWGKLEHFAQTLPRHSATSLSDAAVREKEAAMVADLLKEVDLPLLFAATNKAESNALRMRCTGEALVCVFGTRQGFETLQ
eukprot:2500-Heterococcus_DN1.PRE.1